MTLRWFLKSEKYYNSFKKNFKAKPKYTLTYINKTWTFLVTASSSIFNVKLHSKSKLQLWVQNILWGLTYFHLKIILEPKTLWTQKIVGTPNFFRDQKHFGQKKIWSEIFCEPKNILLRNFFDSNFFSTKLFWPKIIFSL